MQEIKMKHWDFSILIDLDCHPGNARLCLCSNNDVHYRQKNQFIIIHLSLNIILLISIKALQIIFWLNITWSMVYLS